MLKKMMIQSAYFIIFLLIIINPRVIAQVHQDIVDGNLVQFNKNGIWCWYQDEGAVIDTVRDKLIVAFVESALGLGGYPVDGDLNAVIFDLNTSTPQRYLIRERRMISSTNEPNSGTVALCFHPLSWQLVPTVSNLASGVYLYRLSVGSLTTKSGHHVAGEAGDQVKTRKLILMK